ncbi:hypothetical protein QFC19_003571 [Naganishia cerealis]|uniref:Uncharacterized protein n=1 Tax=Naganishia cerealis TaxID=610337 RepID=A0ACC2W2S5_9TREE|nr:hypothetical protein QFC19_003571 [Naganishia cerealis]
MIQSPTQLALMRNELFKLTSVIAQLNAEKEQARAEAAALRAQLGKDTLDSEFDVNGTLASHSTPPIPVYSREESNTQIETPRLDGPPTRPPSNYNSPSPSPMARLEPEDDVDRIRAFSFPKGHIPPNATSRSENDFFAILQPDTPIRTKFEIIPPCIDPTAEDSTAFQIPVTHDCNITSEEYKGYARQIPSAFAIAGRLPSRCKGFENTCGSCRGKVFHL